GRVETRRCGYYFGIATNVLPKRYSAPTLVARGGMGEVYRATDSVLERTVAVKLLSGRFAREPESRARFQREALAAARLSGRRNVVTVFDVGEHRGRPLIVMEYLDGGSIFDRLERGQVTREQALEWLTQTAAALDHAHAHGIVHRDVKPANLLLDRDGSVRVSDFGIASATGFDTLTLPGMVLGTAGYLSPEQARGEPATPASDRYGFGVVAFELLTGRRPFAGDTPATQAFAHLHADVPSATALDSSLPPSVDAVFERALAKDPAARPATCGELVADIRAAFASVDGRSEPAHGAQTPTLLLPAADTPTKRVLPTPPVRRTRRRSNGAALTLVGVVVLAAGIATAALLDATRDAGSQTRRPAGSSQATTTSSPTTQAEAPAPAAPSGADLNDAGFARMQAGDYGGALPFLRDAVLALRGSGSLTEAYASYNLAFSRFALGRCDGVIGLLDRSERIQGERSEIDRLRSEWEATCGDADEEGRGKGKGKGRGRDKGNED
ncbi:MAG TPA: serine/threonine-protein kinase, partial [Gaiellaceae bacterium]|nr:serine/threonine-protein kinase [Gaiellaceae bacterium]